MISMLYTIRDAYGEYTSTEAKYYHIRHGLRFVAIGIPEQDFFSLARELFPGEAAGNRESVCVTNPDERPLTGVVVATMPNLEAADRMIDSFLRNIDGFGASQNNS